MKVKKTDEMNVFIQILDKKIKLCDFDSQDEEREAYAAITTVLTNFLYEITNSRILDNTGVPLCLTPEDKALELLEKTAEVLVSGLDFKKMLQVNKMFVQGMKEEDIIANLKQDDEEETNETAQA